MLQLLTLLATTSVPPIVSTEWLQAHLNDPQVRHNQLYSELETPGGAVRAIRYPARFNGHLLKPRQAAPALGEGNAELFGS